MKPAHRRLNTITAHMAGSAAASNGEAFLPEDHTAYNTYNHLYLTSLHEDHGDVVQLMRDGVPVTFVRSAQGMKDVLQSEDFGKTWDSAKASSSKVVPSRNRFRVKTKLHRMHQRR